MVRPAIVVAVLACAASARASDLPRRGGMYPAQGAALAMVDSSVEVVVRGPVVEATVTQMFRNDSDHVTEATYVFPLPVDAAVSAMAVITGTRTIHAAVELREHAARRYEQAVAAGLSAGILDQERPDVFTQTVAAIPAHGTVAITLRFDTVARFHAGTWQLVLPMVVAPRYVPGTASGRPTTGTGRAPDTDRAPDASRITPDGGPDAGGKTTVTITFADIVDDVTSPTHELAKVDRRYTLSDPHSDHDAIVRWRAHVPAAGWVEQDDDGGYAAVVVEARPPVPRKGALRMVVMLDRSATMRGDGDAVEHPLVRALLGGLEAKDTVSVVGSIQADWHAPEQVLEATERAWTSSPTAFDLSKLLHATRPRGAAVVLVTDGLVADDRAAIAAAREVGAPINVIGVGPAPNRSLLEAIAGATGGTVRFAAVGDDLAALSRDVIADAATPPSPLAVSWGTLAAFDVVPAVLPRLGAHQATLVLARVKHVQAGNARVRGDVFAFASVSSTKPPEGATTPRGSLARRWARIKLDELIGAGDSRAITEHALHYGLVSPTTSMVAIGDDTVIEGGVKHTVPVPVSVPAGMRWQEVRRQLSVDTTATPQADAAGKLEKNEKKKLAPDSRPKPAPRHEADRWDGDEAESTPSRRNLPAQPSAPVATATAGEVDVVLARESAPARSRLHLAASLRGGLVIDHRTANALVAVGTRLETGRLTRFGVEGSLWLVDGLHARGELLGTLGRRGLGRWLELGGGVGLLFGDGIGPALELTLRTRLPVRHLATFLRYDGALRFHDATRDGVNAASVGVEASW